ncbi:MAG: hypothetical protein HYU75_19240 [Betaproteobacteria bacterium]|nr:hypothetical protein [Betaproteobacteria bacterium]
MLWRFIKSKLQNCLAALPARRGLERPYRRELGARGKAAPDRAEQLLLEYLTPEQRGTYWRYGRFIVRGQSGRRYSVWARDPLYCNVCELGDHGQILWRLCAHAAIDVPVGDHLLTQKLMLEHHEAEFRRIANRM